MKKKKNQVISVPTSKSLVKSKPKKTKVKTLVKPRSAHSKENAVAYYNCLLTASQQGWYDPVTGKKQKITACCKNCKLNAPKLQEQRTQEVKKLILSYQQVGDSLKKLLQPIN